MAMPTGRMSIHAPPFYLLDSRGKAIRIPFEPKSETDEPLFRDLDYTTLELKLFHFQMEELRKRHG
jgi:hypothetical protein